MWADGLPSVKHGADEWIRFIPVSYSILVHLQGPLALHKQQRPPLYLPGEACASLPVASSAFIASSCGA